MTTDGADIAINLANGDLIPIEERPAEEVVNAIDRPIAPPGISARNPAFDVTPHRYVSGIVTEAGVVYPPYLKHLREAVVRSQGKE